MWYLDYLGWLESTANAVIKLRREGREATLAYLAWSGKKHYDYVFREQNPIPSGGLLSQDFDENNDSPSDDEQNPGSTDPFEPECELIKYEPWVFEWLAQVEEWDRKLALRMANTNSDVDKLLIAMKCERRHHGPRRFPSRWIRPI